MSGRHGCGSALAFVLLIGGAFAQPPPKPTDTVAPCDSSPQNAARYTVLLAGNRAGLATSWQGQNRILVDGDPVEKISDIRRVSTVVKDGVIYDAAEIDRALGVAPIR